MNTLMHICCAPCANRPIAALREEGIGITGFWFNPNIHPYTEYQARKHTLEAARPCESQADAWPEAERHRYQAILDQCDFETLVQHRYDRFCMQRRNRYMVDRSALVLSVYDGVPKGGTAQTLAYAMRQGVPVQILDPEQGD